MFCNTIPLTPQKILQTEKDKLALDFLQNKQDRQDFLDKHFLYNKRFKTFSKLKIDVDQEIRNKKINLIQRTKIIEQNAIELGLDTCLFITNTLNTQYHKYTKGNTKDNFYFNKNYGGFSVENGYRVLNTFLRNTQKQLASEGISYKFIRVVEPHKDLTAHSHTLLFIQKKDLENVKNILKNKVDKTKKYITKSNTKLQLNVKPEISNTLGKMEIEILKDTTRATAYLTKYVGKNVGGLAWVQGWASKNKIRMVTTSNILLPIFIARKLTRFVPKMFKENGINAQSWLLENTNITYIKEYEDLAKETKIINKLECKKESCFNVVVYKSIAINEPAKITRITIERKGELLCDTDDLILINEEQKEYIYKIIEDNKLLEVHKKGLKNPHKKKCKEVNKLFSEYENILQSLKQENIQNVIQNNVVYGCVEDNTIYSF